ncbi:response regulator [Desulfomicrobium escambiense]|uniref:response regulator n=1 Tax=Desulfomicrobium escambiense TaxID=29503 RepID=UPI00040547DE|nr:two-component system response regulator [Desulfomicrobium escambiense]
MNRPTILIVDDEPTNLSVFSQLLQPDYKVRVCKSGEQALRLASADPRPDLILLDVMMPGLDGYEVLARLREDDRGREIPVIFVTALDDAVDEEFGLHLGAVDYITKPINPAIMQARIRAHLEIKQSRDRLKDQNAWLESEVSRRTRETQVIQNVSMSVILELAETRDTDTGNHIARTQAYVQALGRRLQSHPGYGQVLDEARLDRIVKAAPLHDIGKIGIPDNILLKPGKLTPEEWTIMKTHTALGGQAIRKAIDKAVSLSVSDSEEKTPEALRVLEVAMVIATSHHEKWDGTGYPEGLAGQAIPFPARLMALADVFDALTTPRVYKTPWSIKDASIFIFQQKGRHFDPDVVDAFEAILTEFASIQLRLADA